MGKAEMAAPEPPPEALEALPTAPAAPAARAAAAAVSAVPEASSTSPTRPAPEPPAAPLAAAAAAPAPPPASAAAAVLLESAAVPEGVARVAGPLLAPPGYGPRPDLTADSLAASGFQATQLGRAAAEIRRMLQWRGAEGEKCTIWLSFTSNMISSGLREVFVFLARHRLVDVIVTSAGGVEEDFVKCLAPTFIGEFSMAGRGLREKGWNRIGNLIVPNSNYCAFEDWLQPLLDECLRRQREEGVSWTPSRLIDFLGSRVNDETSLYHWCHVNKIPVFCPGITDGSLGDNLFFHSYRNPGLILDVVGDIRRINDLALKCTCAGMVILGGGIAKHHTCNANMMRNGAEFAVYVNTANEFDGCDSGARPDEAVSWGKIRADAAPIKVNCDATIAFPLIAASSFCAVERHRPPEAAAAAAAAAAAGAAAECASA